MILNILVPAQASRSFFDRDPRHSFRSAATAERIKDRRLTRVRVADQRNGTKGLSDRWRLSKRAPLRVGAAHDYRRIEHLQNHRVTERRRLS